MEAVAPEDAKIFLHITYNLSYLGLMYFLMIGVLKKVGATLFFPQIYLSSVVRVDSIPCCAMGSPDLNPP